VNRYLLLAVLTMPFLLNGCAAPTPSRPIRTGDLLISTVDMPSGWEMLERSDLYLGDQGQLEGAFVVFFYFYPGYMVRAEEDILRYQDSSSAAWNYERLKQMHFNNDQVNLLTQWENPPEFHLENEAAEQWHFACAASTFNPHLGSVESHTQCIYLAQYREYLVLFNTTPIVEEKELITISELNELVKILDNKIGEAINP
jgi:hypothetical protein